MYRSLLVPLDGSVFAEQALPLALSIARRAGTTIHLVRVHLTVAGLHPDSILTFDETLDRELRNGELSYLENLVQQLAAAAPVPVSTALLETPMGPIADAVLSHAESAGVDLVVMTTHGRGPLARFWIGSVSDTIIRQASMPILLVKPKEAPPGPLQVPAPGKVLIPLDGSELAEQILEPALALGATMQAEYTLLRVVKQMTPASYDPTSGRVSGLNDSVLKELQAMDRQLWTEAENYLARLSESLRARSVKVQTRVVSHEQPAAAILEDAQTNAVDLIALATQGRGGLKRLFLGSVADKVVRGAATPVLVYRPIDKPALAGK